MQSSMLFLIAVVGFAIAGGSVAQSPAPTPAPPLNAAPSTPPPSAPPVTPSAPAALSPDAMEGLAAVYSDKLDGRKTASGQAFRQGELTAAHRRLAFGTRVKVTNTTNGKSVEVRINDRGPNHSGRVLDLSRAAAARLGIGKNGTAPVKLEVVGGPANKG